MNRTSQLSQQTVSPYYSRLLKLAALTAVAIIGISLICTIIGLASMRQPAGATPNYFVSTIVFVLNGFLLLIGGLGIGWLATRGKALSRRERIVFGMTYGLLGIILYFPLSGAILLGVFGSFGTYLSLIDYIDILLTVFTLVAVAIIAGVSRLERQSWRRFTMAALVIVFWLIQVVSIFWPGPGADIFNSAHWSNVLLTVAQQLGVPLILFVVFYLAVKRIGRLARAFYATFFVASSASLILSLSQLGGISGALISESAIQVTEVAISIVFAAVVLVGLIRAYRVR